MYSVLSEIQSPATATTNIFIGIKLLSISDKGADSDKMIAGSVQSGRDRLVVVIAPNRVRY